jgi:acetylornithine/succinyldiaminopimelate/putrescine aminotransferase
MNDQNETTMSLADKYMFKTYARFPLTLVRGDGCRVWDEDGKEYLDFVGKGSHLYPLMISKALMGSWMNRSVQ